LKELIYILPLIFTGISYSIYSIIKQINKKYYNILYISIIVFFTIYGYQYYTDNAYNTPSLNNGNCGDTRSVSNYLIQNINNQTCIVLLNGTNTPPYDYYLDNYYNTKGILYKYNCNNIQNPKNIYFIETPMIKQFSEKELDTILKQYNTTKFYKIIKYNNVIVYQIKYKNI